MNFSAMEIFESIIHIVTLIITIAGLLLYFKRLKYYMMNEKHEGNTQMQNTLWAIWLPFAISTNDNISQIRKKKYLNFALSMFYISIIVLFVSIVIFTILK